MGDAAQACPCRAVQILILVIDDEDIYQVMDDSDVYAI